MIRLSRRCCQARCADRGRGCVPRGQGLGTDEEIVKARPFAGQYTLESFEKNNLASYKTNPDYDGAVGAAKNPRCNVKTSRTTRT